MRHWLLVVAVCALVVGGSLFTSCEGDDDKDSNKIELFSFGPMPIARGAELRFIGNNLDKVTAIELPGDIVIQAGQFTKKTAALIAVTVPQNAVEGLLTLKTPQGDIVTKTALGFSEPISIASFAPTAIKPGGELTITGDYLNLVGEVIFTDRVAVAKNLFVSQSRGQIKLIVPEEAQTGKIAVSNAAEDPIVVYSETDLTVALPAFASVSPNPVKAGTQLTITGTNLDLVKKVKFGNNKEVTAFAGKTATQVILTVPIDAKDGNVVLIPASEVEVSSATALLMVKPTLSVSPTTVKNGGELTVTGTNLDLVTKVTFGGGKEGVVKAGNTATQMVVEIPMDAVDGPVAFSTLSTVDVISESLAFVKPVVANVSPTSVKAKETITITGTNLDLVAKVVFGSTEGTISSKTDTQLSVVVPVGATNGAVKLVTLNATTVESSQTVTINVTLPVIATIKSEGPGKKITITGTELDLIKRIMLADKNGEYTVPVTEYGIKSDTKLEFYHVLGAGTGIITPLMITIDGDEGYMPGVYCGSTDAITPQTLMISHFNGGGASQSTWGGVVAFGQPAVNLDGTDAMLGLTGNGWNWTWAHNWDTRPALANPGNYVLKFDICITKAAPDVEVGMTLKGWDTAVNLGKPFGSTTNGNWITMTFDVLNSGMVIDGTGDWGIWINGSNFDLTGVMIDNLRFDPK